MQTAKKKTARPANHGTTNLDKRAHQIVALTPEGFDDNELLTTLQVASWLGVSRNWLEIGRLSGGSNRPPFIKIGPQQVRYRRSDVKAWLESRVRNRIKAEA